MLTIEGMKAEYDAIVAVPYHQRTDEQKERWNELRRMIKQASLAKLGEGVGVMEYDSNNSGGGWWLKDEDWLKLEEAGWTVHWVRPNENPDPRFSVLSQTSGRVYSELPHEVVQPVGSYEWAKDNRYMGAVAVSCAKAGKDANELLREWEAITGQDSADEGCNCCGPPHNFEWHAPDGESKRPSTETVYIQHGF